MGISEREMAGYVKKLEAFAKDVSESKALSKRFLIKIGVLTKKGNITRRYKDVFKVVK